MNSRANFSVPVSGTRWIINYRVTQSAANKQLAAHPRLSRDEINAQIYGALAEAVCSYLDIIESHAPHLKPLNFAKLDY